MKFLYMPSYTICFYEIKISYFLWNAHIWLWSAWLDLELRKHEVADKVVFSSCGMNEYEHSEHRVTC